MYKSLTRTWFKVVDVKAERLKDITIKDIWAEGTPKMNLPHAKKKDLGWYYYKPWRKLWDSINYKRGFGWDKNPWVWVYEYRKIDKK